MMGGKPQQREKLQRTTAAVDALVDNPRNPRIHPAEQIERLVQSIKRFGQPRPILVRAANMMIVAGHGVREACRSAQLAEVEVILWDVDQATADAFMLADNRFGELSRNEDERVAELLREIGEDDLGSVGFNTDEVEGFLERMDPDGVKVHEIDTEPVDDQFWISIRGPIGDQARALKLLRAALAELSDVEVELGSTPG